VAIVKVNGSQLDVEQLGSGPELVLLHSLLTDRSRSGTGPSSAD
jgi:hypothetical protein